MEGCCCGMFGTCRSGPPELNKKIAHCCSLLALFILLLRDAATYKRIYSPQATWLISSDPTELASRRPLGSLQFLSRVYSQSLCLASRCFKLSRALPLHDPRNHQGTNDRKAAQSAPRETMLTSWDRDDPSETY
jgi:hypothetical protein